MEASEGCSVALVILHQPAAARRPSEGSLHNPASRQQDKSAFCLRQFDDVQRDPFSRGSICGGLTGVALIYIGAPNPVTGCVRDCGSEPPDRGPVADLGRR